MADPSLPRPISPSAKRTGRTGPAHEGEGQRAGDPREAPGPAPGGPGEGEEPPPRIRRLDPALIDQIAAGEVVERPASVVKELVENSLDAGAGRVRVEIREGGAALVAVTDDGVGMSPAEARLALERHATSKLAAAADLERIGTFGFRGEALPAIASVSRLRLRSRARGREQGCELRVESGRIVAERAATGPQGTRIEVADLFAGVPARRKYLKTAGTEWGHVAEWVARVALARPDVHWDVYKEGRSALAWPAVADPLERIAAVLSEDQAAALVPVECTAGAVHVHGFASRPDHHRGTASGIHLFVNGRPVRDRLLRHALLEVYRDVLPRGRFPTALLHVDLPAEAVDVNVHPAKWEVRFAAPREIHRAVVAAVREGLSQRQWLAGGRPGPPADRGVHGGERPARAGTAGVAEPQGDWVLARAGRGEGSGLGATAEPAPGAGAESAGLASPGSAAEGIPGAESGAGLGAAVAGQGGAPQAPVRFAELELVGQVLATYLVVESKDALLLVDQHAAHERILYERLRAGCLAGEVERQGLLLSTPLELDPGSAAALAEHAEAVARLGFEVEPFGEAAVVVRAIPALLADRSPSALVRGLAEELRAGGAVGEPGARWLPAADRILATLACHSARRAGERLPAAEQRALLDTLDAIPWAPTCPHGRPVAVVLARGEIERRFARR